MKQRLRGLLFVVFSLWLVCEAQYNHRFADESAMWFIYRSPDTIPPISQGLEKNYRASINNDNATGSDDGVHIDSCQFITITNPLDWFSLRIDSFGRVIYKVFTFDGPIIMQTYDFSKSAGPDVDSIYTLSSPGFGMSYKCYYVVDSVDSIFLDRNRKRMFVRYNVFNPSQMYSDVWIEGIGALYSSFYLPGRRHEFRNMEINDQTLCFYEKGVLVYQTPGFDSCTYTAPIVSSIRNLKSEISLSPNPATTTLTIQSENNFPPQTSFQLFDITGRMILQQELADKTKRIDVSAVSKGMYLYNVVTDKEKLGAGKVVIE